MAETILTARVAGTVVSVHPLAAPVPAGAAVVAPETMRTEREEDGGVGVGYAINPADSRRWLARVFTEPRAPAGTTRPNLEAW